MIRSSIPTRASNFFLQLLACLAVLGRNDSMTFAPGHLDIWAFQGYGFFGRGIFLPSHTTARRYEVTDNLTFIRGHHTMRMGFYELIRGDKTVSDTFFAGASRDCGLVLSAIAIFRQPSYEPPLNPAQPPGTSY
jgi:hypothetical protein